MLPNDIITVSTLFYYIFMYASTIH